MLASSATPFSSYPLHLAQAKHGGGDQASEQPEAPAAPVELEYVPLEHSLAVPLKGLPRRLSKARRHRPLA